MIGKYKFLILTSLSLTILVLVIVNLFIGSYFEEYEVLANQLILGQFTAPFESEIKYNNVHFLILPWIQKLTYLLPSISVYSWLYTIYSFIICFFVILYFLIKSQNKELHWVIRIGTIFLIVLLVSDSFIFINNVKFSLLFVFTAIIWLDLIHSSNMKKGSYIIVGLLFFIGLLTRIEITALVCLIAFIGSIVLLNKKTTFCVFLMLTISLVTYIFYSQIHQKYYPEIYIMHKAEHEFQDRNNIDYELENPKLLQKQLAMTYFITDENNYSLTDYENIITHKSLISYIFSRKAFNSYISKLLTLKTELSSSFWMFLLLFFLIGSILYKRDELFERKKDIYGFIAFVIIFFSIPLLLNAILILPTKFITPYISVGILSIIFFLVFKSKITALHLNLITIFALCFSINAIYKKSMIEKNHNRIANSFNGCIEELESKNINAVVSNINFDIYPSKLFATKRSQITSYHYLDLYFYNIYAYYQNHHKPFFGENYKSLFARIERCSEDDIVFFSTEYYNQILSNYLEEIYNVSVRFEPNDYFETEQLKSYKVVLN